MPKTFDQHDIGKFRLDENSCTQLNLEGDASEVATQVAPP